MTGAPIHASCVACAGRGVLICGASGMGKSSLALALIERGALLVADDYVHLLPAGTVLLASAPDRLRGLLEVRGVGIQRQPVRLSAPVALVAELVDNPPERLPEPAWLDIAGLRVPQLRLQAFAPRNAARIFQALRNTPRMG